MFYFNSKLIALSLLVFFISPVFSADSYIKSLPGGSSTSIFHLVNDSGTNLHFHLKGKNRSWKKHKLKKNESDTFNYYFSPINIKLSTISSNKNAIVKTYLLKKKKRYRLFWNDSCGCYDVNTIRE